MVRIVASLGAPLYGPLRAFYGHAWHSTEGAPGLAGALATARWQATPGNTSGGSYLGILTCDPWPDGPTVLVATAPLDGGHPRDVAVGGISTNRDPAVWRLADVDDPLTRWPRALPPEAQRDPNAYLRQYALAGYTADFTRDGYPPQLVAAAVELVREDERRHPGIDPVQTMHREWQHDRTDPGAGWVPALLAAYHAPPPPPPSREERLADEVRALRRAHLAEAARWIRNTGFTEKLDGRPLTRERRLSAEVTFLREFN